MADAQLYLKVGYVGASLNYAPSDDLLERYNEERPYLDKEFREINVLNGIDAGILYRVGPVGIEGGAELSFAQRRSDGRPAGATEDFRERLFYTLTGYYLGVNFGTQTVYAGGSLVRTSLSFKYNNSDEEDKVTLFDAPGFESLRFYVSIEPPTDERFKLAIRPFVQLPLGDLNIRPLGEFFEPDFAAGASDDVYSDGWQLFGLRIILCNTRG